MLTWHRQQKDECFLSALSIATGDNVNSIRAMMELHMQEPYGLSLSYYTWLKGAQPVLAYYGVVACVPASINKAYARRGLSCIPQDNQKIIRFTPRLLHGKGVLTIAYARTAHAAAFENGVIYDSAMPETAKGLSYKGWLSLRRYKKFKTWRIDRLP